MLKSVCAKFHVKIIFFLGIMEALLHPWGAPKRPILNRNKPQIVLILFFS